MYSLKPDLRYVNTFTCHVAGNHSAKPNAGENVEYSGRAVCTYWMFTNINMTLYTSMITIISNFIFIRHLCNDIIYLYDIRIIYLRFV